MYIHVGRPQARVRHERGTRQEPRGVDGVQRAVGHGQEVRPGQTDDVQRARGGDRDAHGILAPRAAGEDARGQAARAQRLPRPAHRRVAGLRVERRGLSRREKPVRWRFKDGTLYEGTFKWRKGGEREGTGTLYGVNGQVLTDCALIGVSVTIHAHPFRFLSFGRSFSRESGRTSTRRGKPRRSAKRTCRL